MSDLRKDVATILRDHYLTAEALSDVMALIEAELATARREALEAAALKVREMSSKIPVGWSLVNEEEARDFLQMLSGDIRALIPSDITAKAKEHDSKIRREAYLRCAVDCESEARAYSVEQAEPSRWEGAIELLQEAADRFRKWAEEADGGG